MERGGIRKARWIGGSRCRVGAIGFDVGRQPLLVGAMYRTTSIGAGMMLSAPVCLPLCMSVFLSVCLSVCLSVRLSVRLRVHVCA